MNPSLADQLRNATVYDLEQPRFHGMPIFPSHKPGYFYALHRRHRDGYKPQENGPRSGSSGVLTMMEHAGTHIEICVPFLVDCYSHAEQGRRSLVGVRAADYAFPLWSTARLRG